MRLDTTDERARLDEIAGDSWYAQGANLAGVRYGGKVLSRFWRGRSCLELGPAEGEMTELLAPAFERLVLVDGSQTFCAALAERHPAADVHCALFEEWETGERFDTIVLGHVLEHVEDPRALLRRASGWLAPSGRVLAAVPNARSLHRQAAVLMGLLPEEHALNDADRHHGHRRVYDPETLRADVLGAGLTLEAFGGYFLKPLSNGQIERDWTPAMLDAFMALGERYPDVAGEIYVVAGA